MSTERHPDEQGEAPAEAPGPSPSAASAAARQRRLTKQVVFLMLIGWLVAVILVVVVLTVA